MILSEIEKRKIPDFFEVDGKKISTVSDWEKYREKIKAQFLELEYGYLPPKIEPEIKAEDQMVNFANKARWESVFFTFRNGEKSHEVRAELVIPKSNKKVPMFVSIGFAKEVPNKYLPAEEIIDNGFGFIHFHYEDVSTDNNDFTNGLSSLFYNEGEKRSFSKISLWAYMASACVDYLYTREEVDKENIAVIGHSRLGKTALLASALDERFILTCSNESGCCGAAISRGKTDKNEDIAKIVEVFPFWFTEDFGKYAKNEDKLPFDQHMLLALIAPRYLMIGGAIEDVWADNEGQAISLYLASYAWKLYGKNGLLLDDGRLPRVGDILDKGEACFHLREHSHFLSRYDWNVYMKKFKEIGEKR